MRPLNPAVAPPGRLFPLAQATIWMAVHATASYWTDARLGLSTTPSPLSNTHGIRSRNQRPRRIYFVHDALPVIRARFGGQLAGLLSTCRTLPHPGSLRSPILFFRTTRDPLVLRVDATSATTSVFVGLSTILLPDNEMRWCSGTRQQPSTPEADHSIIPFGLLTDDSLQRLREPIYPYIPAHSRGILRSSLGPLPCWQAEGIR